MTTTINKERVRVYTGLLIEPDYWIKTTRTQVGERASEDTGKKWTGKMVEMCTGVKNWCQFRFVNKIAKNARLLD